MKKKKPNIILIMADQFRFDAINAHHNDKISTPTLNQMIRQGTDFTNAYAATPTCIPARASLMSGLNQNNTGLVGYHEGADWNFPNLLGQAFADRGYYAKAVGKMHVSPPRKSCGFHHIDLHDGYLHATRKGSKQIRQAYEHTDDYLYWLKQQVKPPIDLNDTALDCNSWVAREFPYEERLHPTNWATDKAIDFLRWRDPEMPFFLKLSYVRPHSPLDPPKYFFDMYTEVFRHMEKEELSDWAKDMGLNQDVEAVDSLRGQLSDLDYRNMLAGYYGLVTHIDHQINRLLLYLIEYEELGNTIILFTSDHGDQLGEHGLFRKGFAYQSSIHIPLVVYDPGQNIASKAEMRQTVDEIVELRDILPTLIDLATGDSLENVDGMSMKSLMMKKQDSNWRDYLHGEHTLGQFSNHYILKKPWKYIWYSQTGVDQLFNLKEDPNEKKDLSKLESAKVEELRHLLINELKDRPEGFVEESELVSGRVQKANLQDEN